MLLKAKSTLCTVTRGLSGNWKWLRLIYSGKWFRKELLSVMITELAKITENHETHVLTLYYVPSPLLKTEHWDQSDTVRVTRHYL